MMFPKLTFQQNISMPKCSDLLLSKVFLKDRKLFTFCVYIISLHHSHYGVLISITSYLFLDKFLSTSKKLSAAKKKKKMVKSVHLYRNDIIGIMN